MHCSDFSITLSSLQNYGIMNLQDHELSDIFSHWDCLKRSHTLPAIPSTRPPAASNMAETSSSHQAGGVGSSKHLARKHSLPAYKMACSASSVPLKDGISKRRRKRNR